MKTKRFLSLVLVLAMVLGSFGLVAADTAESNPYQRIEDSGIFVGDDGDLMLDKTFTRAEFATVALRLKGEGFTDQETVALNIASSFTDVDAGAWYAPYIGRAEEEGLVQGDGDIYLPKDDVSYVEALTVIMRALGYVDDEDLVNYPTGYFAKAAEIGLADAAIDAGAKIVREVIADTLEVALDLEVNGEDFTLAEELGIEDVVVIPDTLDAEVEVNSAKSFKVTFNKAVEDTDEIEFSVKRGTASVSIKTEWNEEKTEATLVANTTKLAEGIYTITVTDKSEEEAVELVKVDKEIEKEKITSVEFDSDVLVRISDETGIVGYTVRNQYGENITDAALGRGLDWIVSTNAGYDRDTKAGVLEVYHTGSAFNQLKDLKTVVVTVRDVTAGFVQTKSFEVSDTVSVVNDIKLLGIVDEKGETVDFVFDPTKAYYLDFEAFDVNGKQVDYYSALNSMLYVDPLIPGSGTKVLDVRSSNETYVKVELEKDPDNSSKAVYRLLLQGTTGPSYDTPVSFIAMAPFSGKSSTLNISLLRKSRVESFKMQPPAETASIGKSIEIPYTAVDTNGKEITRHEDLDGKITFSPAANLNFIRQADGSTKLFAKFASKGSQYITSTVDGSLTGSFDQILVDVKDVAIPTSITALKHSRAYTQGASWVDRRVSDFEIRDQYDRKMDLRTDASATAYSVRVTSSNSSIVSVNNGSTDTISGNGTVDFKGGSIFGTATITYELLGPVTTKYPTGIYDTVSTLVYNVEMKDIRNVKIVADHSNELYMTTGTRDVDKNMNNEFTMVGLLDSGMEVRINEAAAGLNYTTTDGRFEIVGNKVYANGDFGTNTAVATMITGYVYNENGVLTASTEVKASSVAPLAKEVYVSYVHADRKAGLYTVDNDVIEVTAANLSSPIFDGASIFGFDRSTGDKPVTKATFQFWVNTQYGKKDTGILSNVNVVKNKGAGTITVDQTTGVMTVTGVTAGAEFTITAIANEVIKTITIVVK